VGSKGHIGKNLARTELKLVIAHLLHNFDIELDGDAAQNAVWVTEGDMCHMKGCVTGIKPTPWVKSTRVER
jgi:cytochrome P450